MAVVMRLRITTAMVVPTLLEVMDG